MPAAMGAHHSPRALSCVWLTPPGLLSRLGRFDLDPCSAPEPRPWLTADRMIAPPEDGLSISWSGRVWLNPPYGPPSVISPWMERIARHGTGIALIFARTETAMFFRTVWGAASAILFLEGRLHFHRPDGERAKANAGAPSCLVAYGAPDAEILRGSGIPGRYIQLRT